MPEKPTPSPETIRMYRVENPNIPARPNGTTSHEDLVGQWFSPHLPAALTYLRKATHISRETGKPVEGTRLVIAQVDPGEAAARHASMHPVASKMDFERHNYLLPRDGSIPMTTIELDSVLQELSGTLGNLNNFNEAQRRVITHLGETGIMAE